MTFRFLDLPVELRLVVYEELLCNNNGVIVLSCESPPRRIRCSFDPAILRVSKTIRDEALPILYGSNTFAVRVYQWDMPNTSYTKPMGTENTALIRRVLCEMHVEDMQEAVVRQGLEMMGIQWEHLQLLGLKFGEGLGATCRPESCKPQSWLKEVRSRKAGRKLGLHEWGPLKTTSWFVKTDCV